MPPIHVLGYLAQRAKDVQYLTHRERITLLCTLGHLGDEGRAGLHEIIGHTYNYRREATERHVARLPPWPISCPKIRELHPEATAVKPCQCQFELRGRVYPTPVLFALKPSEVPVFRQSRSRSTKAAPANDDTAASTDKAEAGSRNLQREAEEKVGKIAELKRHRRGIEASLERLEAELAQVFETAKSDTLELPMGRLRRVRSEDGAGWAYLIEV